VVQAAFEHGITTGTNAAQTLFAPGTIRRDQAVSMIVRVRSACYPVCWRLRPPGGRRPLFAGVDPPHGENLRIAEYNGLLSVSRNGFVVECTALASRVRWRSCSTT